MVGYPWIHTFKCVPFPLHTKQVYLAVLVPRTKQHRHYQIIHLDSQMLHFSIMYRAYPSKQYGTSTKQCTTTSPIYTTGNVPCEQFCKRSHVQPDANIFFDICTHDLSSNNFMVFSHTRYTCTSGPRKDIFLSSIYNPNPNPIIQPFIK